MPPHLFSRACAVNSYELFAALLHESFERAPRQIRSTVDEMLAGFAMRPGLICEHVKYRVALAANDVGDGGIGYLNVARPVLPSFALHSIFTATGCDSSSVKLSSFT